MSLTSAEQRVMQRLGQTEQCVHFTLAEETAVEIRINGEPFAVLMATPADLHDLACGFALTEGYLASAGRTSVTTRTLETGMIVDLAAPDDARNPRNRSMAARSSCGLCGVTTLAEAIAETPRVAQASAPDRQAILQARAALPQWQALNQATRAVHAAAWCLPDGSIEIAREDIGRHNALDKLLGARARAKTNQRDGFVFISSRISYELIQKCAMAGVSNLVAISAPTRFAVRLARAANINLIAMAREDSDYVFTAVSHHHEDDRL